MGKVKIEIDCVIFYLDGSSLKILVVKEKDETGIKWRLPNDGAKKSETIEHTVNNIIKRYTNAENYFAVQLKAFSDMGDSNMQEKIIIGYYALIKKKLNTSDNIFQDEHLKWASCSELEFLNHKDRSIVNFSLQELRKTSCQTTAAFNLLPEKFTVLQAVNLYEEIFKVSIDKSNFRRKIFQRGLLKESEEKEENVSHRAAKYYSLNQDYERYPYYEFLNIGFKEKAEVLNDRLK